MDKSRKKIAQDYSRNAIADSKSSKKSIKKDGKYEAKMMNGLIESQLLSQGSNSGP